MLIENPELLLKYEFSNDTHILTVDGNVIARSSKWKKFKSQVNYAYKYSEDAREPEDWERVKNGASNYPYFPNEQDNLAELKIQKALWWFKQQKVK